MLCLSILAGAAHGAPAGGGGRIVYARQSPYDGGTGQLFLSNANGTGQVALTVARGYGGNNSSPPGRRTAAGSPSNRIGAATPTSGRSRPTHRA